MAIYRFKIFFEEDENIIREIDIKSTQTFENFHATIQTAIGFDGAHPASFYVSSESWRKGKEIILLHKHSRDLKGTWMHETKIAAYVEDPHQKFVYEFDPDGGNWTLFVELMKITPEAPVIYPRINKSVGAAPPQYKVTSPEEIPAVEEEEDDVVILDDSEDRYIHPEAEEHFGAGDDDEAIPHRVVREVAGEMAEEEAIEEIPSEDEVADEEDESAEQHEEEFE